MRTEIEIRKVIDEIDSEMSADMDSEYRNALEWVLDTEGSAMCEADSNAVLADVRADIEELLKSIDEYHETFSTAELESFLRQKLDAGVKMMRLKNKVSEHFS